MGRIVTEVALVAGAIALEVLSDGIATPLLTPALLSNIALGAGLMGGGMMMTSIAQALAGGGPSTSTSVMNPAAFRKTIYGQTRTAGTKIYVSTVGGNGYNYNQVIAWASHPCNQVSYIYADGREVYFTGNQHSAFPGAQGYNDEIDHYDPANNKYNFGGSSGGNYHLAAWSSLGSYAGQWLAQFGAGCKPPGGDYNFTGDGTWNSTCTGNGICHSAVCAASDANMFGNFPSIKALIQGKCNIYDPRAIPTVGTSITITGMAASGNNGTFPVSATTPASNGVTGTFTVSNSGGATGGIAGMTLSAGFDNSISTFYPYAASANGQMGTVNVAILSAVQSGSNTTYNYSCNVWTQNAALIIADHMTNSDYGLAIPWSKIDTLQLVAAANICDQQITLATGLQNWQANYPYTIGQMIVNNGGYQQTCIGFYGSPSSSSKTHVVFSVANGGSGYQVGDTLNVYSSNAPLLTLTSVIVASIGTGGVVESVSTSDFSLTTAPDAICYTSGGHGTGCTLNATSTTMIVNGGTSGSSIPVTWSHVNGGITYDHQIIWQANGMTGTTVYESQYQINGEFEWSSLPGDTLTHMLDSCAGRLAYWNGQYKIMPGTWYGSSGVNYTMGDILAPPTFKKTKSRDLFNAVRAKYTCPSFPYSVIGFDKAHKATGIFDGQYQPTDAPVYMEDYLHGYGTIASPYQGDQWLAADGGVRLWQDKTYQYVQSVGQCQRLMKITLLRDRFQWQGTIRVNAKALQNAPGDIVTLTIPTLNFNTHLFEILEIRHVVDIQEGKPPQLAWELDLKETDPSIYTWSTAEERSMTNTASPTLAAVNAYVAPVTGLALECDITTALTSVDGIVGPQILATWTEPADTFVTSGGSVVVQYQLVGATTWTQAAICSGITTQCYIGGVVAGKSYNVQVQAKHAGGASSVWVAAGPILVPATIISTISAGSVVYPGFGGNPPKTVGSLEPGEPGSDNTGNNTVVAVVNPSFSSAATSSSAVPGWTVPTGWAVVVGGVD